MGWARPYLIGIKRVGFLKRASYSMDVWSGRRNSRRLGNRRTGATVTTLARADCAGEGNWLSWNPYPIRVKAMTTLEISLPDGLAKEAKAAGLLSPDAIERMVREAIRRRAMEELKQAMDRMAAVAGPVMTPEEIQEEIKAARAERRAREARAAGP
jgi:hypothetical protein